MAVDTYALAERFAKHLRVTDVTDGLDAVILGQMTPQQAVDKMAEEATNSLKE